MHSETVGHAQTLRDEHEHENEHQNEHGYGHGARYARAAWHAETDQGATGGKVTGGCCDACAPRQP
ncbi:hypothetical protein Sm713_09620 [Streptomyces sp. TS71-3]|nr:hypothetical protein Sm713_09620 [Streptomyces sp. TS71-3]